jgi:hypothetical protein
MINKLAVLLLTMFVISSASAQSAGTLNVTTTTKAAGGNYAPRNIVAIWVEDGSGKFVKTLTAYAKSRITHLNTWEASTTTAGSAFNKVDAITGATRTSHGTLTTSWNGTDYKGNQVADGTYKLRLELTDKNSTGNQASFSFNKSGVLQELTLADVPSFTKTSIQWKPNTTTGLMEMNQPKEFAIKYDASSGQLLVSGVSVKKIEIHNLAGQLVLKNSSAVTNLNNLQNGVYLVVVKTDAKVYCQKIMKNDR